MSNNIEDGGINEKKMKDLNNENEGVKTQHNHLYVGSTSELQKFLKKENKKD